MDVGLHGRCRDFDWLTSALSVNPACATNDSAPMYTRVLPLWHRAERICSRHASSRCSATSGGKGLAAGCCCVIEDIDAEVAARNTRAAIYDGSPVARVFVARRAAAERTPRRLTRRPCPMLEGESLVYPSFASPQLRSLRFSPSAHRHSRCRATSDGVPISSRNWRLMMPAAERNRRRSPASLREGSRDGPRRVPRGAITLNETGLGPHGPDRCRPSCTAICLARGARAEDIFRHLSSRCCRDALCRV